MMRKNSKKENLGITLIALVITIIILLILAGVSINFIFGNEGIFSKTQTAVETYQNATEQENYVLAQTVDMINNRENVTIDKKEYEDMKAKINSLTSYSTGEQVVGKWIDGKPIYQRIIEVNKNMPASGQYLVVETEFIAMDTLISADCLYKVLENDGKGAFCVTSTRGEIVYENANYPR